MSEKIEKVDSILVISREAGIRKRLEVFRYIRSVS